MAHRPVHSDFIIAVLFTFYLGVLATTLPSVSQPEPQPLDSLALWKLFIALSTQQWVLWVPPVPCDELESSQLQPPVSLLKIGQLLEGVFPSSFYFVLAEHVLTRSRLPTASIYTDVHGE